MAEFWARFVEVVKEGHTVLGILPGCYDGWLLDYEGEVKDPFTRTERLLALGMNISCTLLVDFFGGVAAESTGSLVLRDKVGAVHELVHKHWGDIVKAVVSGGVNFLVGPARCKAVLQNSWNSDDTKLEAPEDHRKANMAKLWALAVFLGGALFLYTQRKTQRARAVTKAWAASFLQSALLTEPATMLATLGASYLLSRPICGISYAKRGVPIP